MMKIINKHLCLSYVDLFHSVLVKTSICLDVKKMYHSVKMNKLDQHTHRYLWRDLDTSKPPDTYIILVVSFGDRPAGTIASVALRNTVVREKEEYPNVHNVVANNTYVDDILDSVGTMKEAKGLSSDIETVLEKGGFRIKEWVFTGSESDESVEMNPGMEEFSEIKQKGQKELGVWWHPKDNYFHFKI